MKNVETAVVMKDGITKTIYKKELADYIKAGWVEVKSTLSAYGKINKY